MRLVLVGPPGAGKGTQAQFIAEHSGVPKISTGDIFRANVKNETELGLKVKAILDAGDYVPDSLTNELISDRLSQADAAEGFLLDGYPRTLQQVEFLDDHLGRVRIAATLGLQTRFGSPVQRRAACCPARIGSRVDVTGEWCGLTFCSPGRR